MTGLKKDEKVIVLLLAPFPSANPYSSPSSIATASAGQHEAFWEDAVKAEAPHRGLRLRNWETQRKAIPPRAMTAAGAHGGHSQSGS